MQSIWTSINATTTSGIMLAGLLDDFKDSLMSGLSGTTRPSTLLAGGMWVDTTNQAAPNYYWAFKLYTGTTDVEIFRISILNNFGGTLMADSTFQIQEIKDDSIGAILQLVKNRIDNNGQVLNNDVVGEIRFVGKTDSNSDPIVAYFQWTSTDDEVTATSGGTFSFFSTADSSSAIAEHFRFINGFFETVKPHKINSQISVVQSVATAATISQLSASNIIVEMTGATATDIQGIASSGNTKRIVVHNRSSANVTLKHQNTSATAADRLKLPNSNDVILRPQDSATLYYCTTDAYWKLLSVVSKKLVRTQEFLNGAYQQWTCPSGVTRVQITSKRPLCAYGRGTGYLDKDGNMYKWGSSNTTGELATGDVLARSSPTLVVGGVKFLPWFDDFAATYGIGIDEVTGITYAWGFNTSGTMGDGTVIPKSSPVAVIGGIKFSSVVTQASSNIGLTDQGVAYAWGDNTNGNLGVGDVVGRSSPVAVLGGLKFSRIFPGNNQNRVFGITKTGDLYAWGENLYGTLGVGDLNPRSSPVAVLGGLKWKKVIHGNASTGQFSTFGLTTSGQVYGWGSNQNGNLGNGNLLDRSSPVLVAGLPTIYDITMGRSDNAYAITSDGTLYSWGINTNGQCGDGTVTLRSSPVAVIGGLKFKKVFTTLSQNTFALATDDTLYAWGDNSFGSLGVGDVNARSSPVAVLGGLKFVSVWNGRFGGFLGITTDGTVYGWGQNTSFGIGVGDAVNRSSPVQILGPAAAGLNFEHFETEIDVVPGTVYDVVLSQSLSTFNKIPIGRNVDNIVIQYDT